MKMDERQYEAVHTTGTNILVSASAGAGKTRVLVERLVKRCLEDHVGMDEILAVTFTEAAAAEMKNRVAKALQDRAGNQPSREEADWLKRQIVLLADADITTIDSFCLNLIRKYYSVIGLDPATVNRVLDEGTRQNLLNEAFLQAMEEADRDSHEDLLRLLEGCAPRSEDFETLRDMVFSVMNMAEQYSDSEAWLDQAASAYDGITSLKDLPSPVCKAFFGMLRLKYQTIEMYLEEMIELSAESEKLQKKASDLRNTQNLLLSCRDALAEENYDLFRELFGMFGMEQKTPSDSKAEAYTRIRDVFYEACDSLSGILYDSDVLLRDTRDLSADCHLIVRLTRDTMRFFQEAKRRIACMDFTDMEQFAWDILNRNDREVAKLYRARLKEVMVDEFQDTSLLQNDIITCLAAPGTIFRVGDVKQSIYRFRGARPSLMRSLMNDPDIRHITLNHNYRSLDTIIRFSNILFSRLMNIEGAEDRYSEEDTVSPGVPSQTRENAEPIRLILLEQPENKDAYSLPPFSEIDPLMLKDKPMKAAWMANRMIELHEQGYQWKDFAVLVRSHAEKIILRSVFEKARIPAEIDTREGFWNSDLARYMLALMSLIADPEDDLALLTVLKGELFEYTDEALALLKLKHGSLKQGIREERPDIMDWLSGLFERSHEGLIGVLDEVSQYSGFYDRLHDSSKANFDFLYEKVCALSANGLTIYDLIDIMTIGAEERSSNASCRSRDDDLVTVTTIHQSKGLQYKFVFLWGTRMNPDMESRNEILTDSEIGPGLRHHDLPWHTVRPSIHRIAAEYRDSIADVEEYTRVLYVALTRAEETLYIVDIAKAAQPYRRELTLSDLVRRKGITGLLTAALNPIPGLFEIQHEYPRPLLTAAEAPVRYLPEPLRFHGDPLPLPRLLRPSEHELTSLPSLSPGSSSRGSRYGTLMHETIAALPNRRWTKDDFPDDTLREHDIAALLAFSDSSLYSEALKLDIHKEMPFYAIDSESGKRITGVMDFAAFGDDRIILIDFKTDALSPEEIRRRYTDQLNAYRRALEILSPGIPVEAYAWSFHSSCPIPIT